MPRSPIQNEQMRAESRQKIVSTARRLFAQRGYDRCNVSDIAREAGMSQGNIYWYFSSKEEILKAVLANAFEALGKLLSEVNAHPGTGIEKLNTLIERYIDFGERQGGAEITIIVTSLIGQGGLQRLSDLDIDTTQIGAGVQQLVAKLLVEAQAEGAILPGLDPNLLAMLFPSLFNGLVITYRNHLADIPREALHAAVLRLLGSGEK